MISDLTGEPFSANATIELVNKTVDEVLAEAQADIAREKTIPRFEGKVELDCKVKMIHGDEVIASTEGSTFEAMAAKYGEWIREKASARV